MAGETGNIVAGFQCHRLSTRSIASSFIPLKEVSSAIYQLNLKRQDRQTPAYG
jgi:hypothetical protein